MRVALVVNHITENINSNLETIIATANNAADAGADLVVFPEAAITGLINNDEPTHDFPLAQPIPGPYIDTLAKIAQERSIHLAIGILEREGSRLYDTAILLSLNGEIVLKYRRINPQWHSEEADKNIYCQGKDITKVNTSLGSFMFLICGDLFEDDLIAQVERQKPDWLLFPFARSFSDGTYDQKQWDKEEKSKYVAQVKLASVTTLMVNYLADKNLDGGSFDGAMVISASGEITQELPIGKSGILYVEM